MTRDIFLTIAIPTFNRNAILVKNLGVLLSQLTDICELVIIDNHSDTPVEESILIFNAIKKTGNIRIVRNVANVGGNENILRCLEYSKGEYVWILGDDDIPCSNAINNILDEINAYPDAVVINMLAEAPSHKIRHKSKLLKGADGYLTGAEFLGELMFISSMVFKKDHCLKHISTAHLMQSTFAPQLVLTLLSLSNEGLSLISHKKTVTSGGATTPLSLQYPSIYVAIGIAGLLDYRWSNSIHSALLNHLINVRRIWMTPYGIINQLLQISRNSESPDSRCIAFRLYFTIGRRLYSLGSLINLEKILFRVGVFALIWPQFGHGIKRILWRIRKRNTEELEASANSERL